MTAFCSPRYRADYALLVRLAFCKKVDVLEQGASQLAALATR